MGEIADYYIDKMLDDRRYPEYPLQRKQIVWTTSNGTELEIEEMEDTHLMNVIHLCERREGHRGVEFLNNAPTYIGMVDELIKRGLLTKKYYLLNLEDRKKTKI